MTQYIPFRRAGGPMEPCGTIWPNGEFSVGYAPAGGLERELTAEEYAYRWDEHLDLTIDSNSHTEDCEPLTRRGQSGITPYGRRLLRNVVEALEVKYHKSCLSFVTLTLPRMSFEEHWNVSTNWSEIVRVFYQRLGRYLSSKGLPTHYAGCTELQPRRTERDEVPALHLHFVCVGRRLRSECWGMRPADVREFWRDSVSRYCFQSYSFDNSERIESIRYSAAGYLSKYLSKGTGGCPPLCSQGTGWSLPTAWYNVSLVLKRAVKGKIMTAPDRLSYLEHMVTDPSFRDSFEYLFSGTVPEMSGPGPHFYVGRMKRAVFEEFKEAFAEIARARALAAS